LIAVSCTIKQDRKARL